MYIEMLIMISILIILLIIFKKKRKFTTKEIVVISMFTALASAVRVVMMAIPNAKPTSFIIISGALLLGREAGFIIGCLVPLISNIYLGMGPWLPWQMALWGLMGLMAPMIKGKNRIIQASYGFVWGMIFGWVMNLWYYTTGIIEFSLETYIISCMHSFQFDILHAVANAVLLFVFSTDWLEHIIKVTK